MSGSWPRSLPPAGAQAQAGPAGGGLEQEPGGEADGPGVAGRRPPSTGDPDLLEGLVLSDPGDGAGGVQAA